MKPHEKAIEELENAGYRFARKGGRNHDIYFNKELGSTIPLKRHDFDEYDLMYIKQEIRKCKRDRG